MTQAGDLARLEAALELETGEGVYLVRLGYPRDGEQVGALLERLGRTVVHVQIPTGVATKAALLAMEEPRGSGSILWLDLREALATDQEAFAWMFARINEHRNELLRTAPCPWVISAPEWLVKGVRDWAPDLWSVRRGEFEIAGSAAIDAPPLPYRSRFHPAREVAELRGLRARLQKNPADSMAMWSLHDALGERARRQLEAGRADTALDLARESLELARRVVRYDPQLPAFRRSLADALDVVGDVEAAAGNHEAARSAYAESLDLRRALVDFDRTQPGMLHDIGLSLDHLGDIDLARGSLESARTQYAEALAVSRQLLASDPTHAGRRRDLAISLSKLGDVDLARGALETAQASYEESLHLLRELEVRDSAPVEALRDVAMVLNRLGAVQLARGKADQARGAYAESLDVIRGVLDREPSQPGLRRDLCAALRAIARAELTVGDLPRAHAACVEAVSLARWLRLSDPTRPQSSRDLSECLGTLGSIERVRGDAAAARVAYQEALGLCEQAIARDPRDAQAHLDLAAALLELSDLDPAAGAPLLDRAIASARAGHTLAPALVRSRSLLASLLRRRGDPGSLQEAELLGLALSTSAVHRRGPSVLPRARAAPGASRRTVPSGLTRTPKRAALASMRFAISITHNFLLEPFMKTMGVSREDSFVEVDKETLHVRMGRWFDEKIPVARIKAIAPSDWPWWGGLGVKLGHHGVGVVGSMDHIVNIKFGEEIRVRVLVEVGVEQMWISLEDRDGFLRALADATGVAVSPHTPF